MRGAGRPCTDDGADDSGEGMRSRSIFVGRILAAVVAGTVWASSLAHAESFRTTSFTPDRPERCTFFFVTEFDAGVTGGRARDVTDRFLFTDALGLMANIDRTRAVGASLDVHLVEGAIRFTPTFRFKQWLAGRRSLDASLGYAFASAEEEGLVGTIGTIRYSPTQWFHLQAAACRVRNVTSIRYSPDFHVEGDTRFHLYAGVGLGGVPGIVSWGAQGVGFLTLVALFSGLD